MRITEITNAARKIIRNMESLYVDYSINGSIEVRERLSQLITKNLLSKDGDVIKQAEIYESKHIWN